MSARLKTPGRFFWKLFLGNAALLALVLTACVYVLLSEFERFYDTEFTTHLRTHAMMLRGLTAEKLSAEHAAELDRIAKQVGSLAGGDLRITFIAPDGSVWGDSQADPAEMESHRDRPEIRQALDDGWGHAERASRTILQSFKYVAVRAGPVDAPTGFIRVAMPIHSIREQAASVRKLIWTITGVTLLAAVALALGLNRLWSRPIRRITATARRLSGGDLRARARIRGSDELAVLARSLNEMGERLGFHLETIDGQRRTLESMLAQLQEGVIAAGPDGRIVLLNPAAARLLELDPARSHEGLQVEQCVANHELQQMLISRPETPAGTRQPEPSAPAAEGETEASRGVCQMQLEIDTAKGTISILARAWDILLPSGRLAGERRSHPEPTSPGRLLVLTDVTGLTKLVQMKNDFVVNASHELRTPLSAIRAAVETLLTMKLADEDSKAPHFLQMVNRHTRRLEALVADLLDLSRIESAPHSFKPGDLSLPRFFDELSEKWAPSAEARELTWRCEADPQVSTIRANGQLLSLALDNLVDNAIKFTDPGGEVCVSCRGDDKAVQIDVTDNGCGIAPEEHGRVFERFYQVERARPWTDFQNGERRGTGLGLAIVKHAVAAMNGQVSLESSLGRGTRVTVTLPRAGPWNHDKTHLTGS